MEHTPRDFPSPGSQQARQTKHLGNRTSREGPGQHSAPQPWATIAAAGTRSFKTEYQPGKHPPRAGENHDFSHSGGSQK